VKDILDVIVWIGMIYILFVFLRGMNETQMKKHDERIKENQERQNKND